jgi:hypothetical protein
LAPWWPTLWPSPCSHDTSFAVSQWDVHRNSWMEL